jgi:hypothetical protein
MTGLEVSHSKSVSARKILVTPLMWLSFDSSRSTALYIISSRGRTDLCDSSWHYLWPPIQYSRSHIVHVDSYLQTAVYRCTLSVHPAPQTSSGLANGANQLSCSRMRLPILVNILLLDDRVCALDELLVHKVDIEIRYKLISFVDCSRVCASLRAQRD